MNTEKTLALITNIRKELDGLEMSLRKATDVQWERSPSTQTSETERRGRGGYSDPTGDTATDPKRMSVRRSVVASEHELQRVYLNLRSLAGVVRQSVGTWEGR